MSVVTREGARFIPTEADEGSSGPTYPGAITRARAKEIERNTEITLTYLATLAHNELSLFGAQVSDVSLRYDALAVVPAPNAPTLVPDVPLGHDALTLVPAPSAPTMVPDVPLGHDALARVPAPNSPTLARSLMESQTTPSSSLYLVLSNSAF